MFTINCPAPPVNDLAPPQHLPSKFSGAAPGYNLHLNWHAAVLYWLDTLMLSKQI